MLNELSPHSLNLIKQSAVSLRLLWKAQGHSVSLDTDRVMPGSCQSSPGAGAALSAPVLALKPDCGPLNPNVSSSVSSWFSIHWTTVMPVKGVSPNSTVAPSAVCFDHVGQLLINRPFKSCSRPAFAPLVSSALPQPGLRHNTRPWGHDFRPELIKFAAILLKTFFCTGVKMTLHGGGRKEQFNCRYCDGHIIPK